MKKTVLWVFLLLSFVAKGQDSYLYKTEEPVTRYNTIKTNPLAMFQGPIPLVGEYRLVAERANGLNRSFQIGVSYMGKGMLLALMEAQSDDPINFLVTGYRLQFEYRFFLNATNQKLGLHESFYLAPYVSISEAKITNRYYNTTDEYIKASYKNACVKVGYQYFWDRVVLDVFVGGGYRDNSWVEHFNQTTTTISQEDMGLSDSNVKILFGFNLGVTW